MSGRGPALPQVSLDRKLVPRPEFRTSWSSPTSALLADHSRPHARRCWRPHISARFPIKSANTFAVVLAPPDPLARARVVAVSRRGPGHGLLDLGIPELQASLAIPLCVPVQGIIEAADADPGSPGAVRQKLSCSPSLENGSFAPALTFTLAIAEAIADPGVILTTSSTPGTPPSSWVMLNEAFGPTLNVMESPSPNFMVSVLSVSDVGPGVALTCRVYGSAWLPIVATPQ